MRTRKKKKIERNLEKKDLQKVQKEKENIVDSKKRTKRGENSEKQKRKKIRQKWYIRKIMKGRSTIKR